MTCRVQPERRAEAGEHDQERPAARIVREKTRAEEIRVPDRGNAIAAVAASVRKSVASCSKRRVPVTRIRIRLTARATTRATTSTSSALPTYAPVTRSSRIA